MRGNDGTLYRNERDRAKLWKAHMSKIMNEENEWDQIRICRYCRWTIGKIDERRDNGGVQILKDWNGAGPTEVHAEMIIANGDVEIRVLVKSCYGILDGKGMPEDWATSVAITISKGK